MADYSMLGSFSTGGASSLSGDLITKLRDAEEKSIVTPLETKLETWDKELAKITEINEKITAFATTAMYFDISSDENVFNQVLTKATGTSVVFDAVSTTGLDEGTTTVTVSQLAQKDVFQSAAFADKEVVPTGTNASDKISIQIGSGTAIDFETTGKTYEEISEMINNQEGISSSVEQVGDNDYRLIVKSTDSGTSNALTITQTGLDVGFDTLNEQVKSTAITSTDIMPDGDSLVIDGVTFTNTKEVQSLTISGTVDDSVSLAGAATTVNFLGHNVDTAQGDTAEDLASQIAVQSADVITTWNAANPDNEILSITQVGVTSELEITYKNTESDVSNIASETSNGLVFSQSSETTKGLATYADMVTQINAHADFNASINSDNEIEITRTDGGQVGITTDNFALGFAGNNLNHTLKAQNLNAKVDGIDYDVSSNTIELGGNLSMTAVEVNTAGSSSSVTVTKDTSAALSATKILVNDYNELTELITEELNATDSSVQNKSTLKTILSDIKNMFFSNYGADSIIWTDPTGDKNHANVSNNDKNIFNYGFELDSTGKMSLDETKFTEALSDDVDVLKGLFVGVHENKGLGTQLSEYMISLNSYEGLLSSYATNMDANKEKIEDEKEKAVSRLDTKYQTMAESFSAYGSMITQMESAFSGLKMMIAQSQVSSS